MSDTNDVAVDSSPTINTEPVAEAPVAETAGEVIEPKAIPYERFQEVNDKYKETAATVEELNRRIAEMEQRTAPQAPAEDPNLATAREQIKALGFIPKEELEQTLRQKEEDARLEQTLTQLENTFKGEDGMPKFSRKEVIDFALAKGIPDPEAAFKLLKEKEILDWHIQQALTKSKGIKSESSDGSGSQQSGTTDADLKEGIRQGDKAALHTYLKRLAKS